MTVSLKHDACKKIKCVLHVQCHVRATQMSRMELEHHKELEHHMELEQRMELEPGM